VRPAAPGFRRVRIAPQPGTLTWIDATMPHPRGSVRVRAEFAAGRVEAEIELPADTSGTWVWGGREVTLREGRQRVSG